MNHISKATKQDFANNKTFVALVNGDPTGKGALARLYRLAKLHDIEVFVSKQGLPTKSYKAYHEIKIIMAREHNLETPPPQRIPRGLHDVHFTFGGIKDLSGNVVTATDYLEMLAKSMLKRKLSKQQRRLLCETAVLIEEELIHKAA